MKNLPPQRLVLRIPPTRQVRGRDFSLFVEQMRKYGVADDTSVTVEIQEDGSLKFHMPVPDQNPPRKSRHRQAVEAQIASRRDKIANGEEVPGYVPPVKPKRVVKIPRQIKRNKTARSAKSRTERKPRE
ncbi:hypothetical protein GCM10010423_65540 [Streptomyces levis]|uniref:Uncharacterized protein n=1 Tax=Streptomyces levis TaxID=285566 RepID=A0ABP6BBY5_9ACTN